MIFRTLDIESTQGIKTEHSDSIITDKQKQANSCEQILPSIIWLLYQTEDANE